MATVKGVIDVQTKGTDKAARGLKQVSEQTDGIGRAQTRLGQSSASAGRSFSAQASGLGGLVGVYAAAAANVFAITAAFDALGRAAQAEQIVRGTKLLALEIGQSGKTILENVKQITQSQLTLAEAAQNVNIALSAGFNSDQIEQLSEVSLKASRALGRNLTDAFQRVVRGASKLEPELLDELGIFTRIDPAVESYASKLNIATNSLTNYEKRQAFVNAVIEEGQKKFSAIDTSVGSSQKSLEQLRVQLTQLGEEFGQLIANGLLPVVDFIKNNIGNALLLFGGILGLVFGRAIKSIGIFAAQSTSKLGTFADNLADKAKISEDSLKKLQVATAQPFRGGAGLSGIPQVKDQDQAQLERFRSAVAQQTSGQVTSVSQLNKVNQAYKEQLKITNQNTKSYTNLKDAIERNNAALSAAGGRATTFTGLSNILGASVKGLTLAFRFLGTAINAIFIGGAVLQLAGTLFDKDFLGGIKDAIKGNAEAFEELAAGVKSATVAAAGGTEELVKSLNRVGATKKEIEELDKNVGKLGEEVLKTAENNKILANSSVLAFDSEFSGLNAVNDQLQTQITATDRLAAAQKLLAEEESKGDEKDRVRVKLLEKTTEGLAKYGELLEVVGGVSRELGLAGDKVLTLINSQDNALEAFVGGIDTTGKSFAKLSESTKDSITSGVLLVNTLDKSSEAFERGSATSETLSKQLGGAKKALDDVRKAQAGVFGEFAGDSQLVKDAQARVEELNEQVRILKTQEQIGKALTDTFGKFSAKLDKAVQEGLVGIGGISQSQQEIAKNQVNFLLTAAGLRGDNIEKVKQALIAEKSILGANAEQVKLLENRTKALKSINGVVLSLPGEIKKELDAQDKITLQLSKQLITLEEQVKLQEIQNKLALEKAQQETRAAVGGAQIKNLQLQLNISEEIAKQQERQAKHEIDILNIRNQQLDRLSKIDEIQANRATAAAQAARERGIANQQSVISDFKAFPNLRSLEELQVEQRKLIDLELQNQLAIIDAKEEQAAREATRQLDAVLRQEEIFNKQIQSNEEQRKALLQNQQIETQIRQQEQALEIQKIADNKANLEGQLAVIAQQRELAQAGIDAQKSEFAAQAALEQQRIDAIRSQETLVNGLREALSGDSAFVQAVDEFLKQQGGTGVGAVNQSFEAVDAGIDKLLQNQSNISTLRQGITDARTRSADLQASGQSNVINEQIVRQERLLDLTAEGQVLENQLAQLKNQSAVDELDNSRAILEEKTKGLDSEIELINESFAAKQEGYEAERDAAKQAGEERLRQLKREADTLGDLGNAVIGNINDGVGNAFQTAFDNLASGKKVTDGLGDVLRNTFESVRKTVLEETLIKPLQENIKSGLGGLFGFGDSEKGADNADVTGGALHVVEQGGSSTINSFATEANNAGSTFKNTLVEGFGAAKEKGSDFFSSITNSFGNLGSSVSSIFSSIGGGISSLFGGGSSSGGSSILGSLFSGVTSMFGGGAPDPNLVSLPMASGGLVRKFAAGGMQRDRVPAMLEPGEFVVRKPAVQAAGGMGAMQQLNATGQMGGPPVSINVTNEGQPKEAEQQGPPKFDGDKMVVDIVLRDLRTNGPIRRAMRGGEAQ